MEFYKIVLNFMEITISISILLLLILSTKSTQKMTKYLKYLQDLIDILGDGLCSPIHKMLFKEIKNRGIKNPMTYKEQQIFFKEKIFEFYNKDREKAINQLKTIDDPVVKNTFEKRLQESDNVINLLNTIDENTSKEQMEIIMNNIANSINIINNIDKGNL